MGWDVRNQPPNFGLTRHWRRHIAAEKFAKMAERPGPVDRPDVSSNTDVNPAVPKATCFCTHAKIWHVVSPTFCHLKEASGLLNMANYNYDPHLRGQLKALKEASKQPYKLKENGMMCLKILSNNLDNLIGGYTFWRMYSNNFDIDRRLSFACTLYNP